MAPISLDLFEIIIIVPILLYVGYIVYERLPFSHIVVFVILMYTIYVIITHFWSLIRLLFDFKVNKYFEKEVGIFIILFAILILIHNIFKIHIKTH